MNRPRVLLVEDDREMAAMLTSLLDEDGIELAVAGTVEAAWDKISRETFELVLLDLGLPGKDGFELLRRIKGSAGTPQPPVIIVTAWNGSEDKVKGFDLGAADYLTKPFDSAELRARVQSVLRAR